MLIIIFYFCLININISCKSCLVTMKSHSFVCWEYLYCFYFWRTALLRIVFPIDRVFSPFNTYLLSLSLLDWQVSCVCVCVCLCVWSYFLIILFYCYSITVVSIFPLLLSLTLPTPLLPQSILTPLSMSMGSLYMFLDLTFLFFSPIIPLPLPSGHCQFVLYFHASGSI